MASLELTAVFQIRSRNQTAVISLTTTPSTSDNLSSVFKFLDLRLGQQPKTVVLSPHTAPKGFDYEYRD